VVVALILVLRRQEKELTARAEEAMPGPLEKP
jgi:hypothetical protein